MKVKTITGSSIHAALAEARRLLGDNVVLLESTPPTDSEPARITVLADAATLREAAVPAQVARRAIEETAPLVQAGYGYGAIQRSQRGLQSQEENARLNESFSPAGDDRYQTPPAASSRVSPAARRPGRARLFPEAAEEIRPANPPGAPSSTVRLEKLFEAQLMLIHERLEDMERRLAGAVIGASQRWVTHPLFAALLAQGFQPATVASLFDSLVEKGFQVDEDEEKLKWSLANEVRHRLTMPAARQTNGTQVFIGPSGAGKTTLLLKLATHPDFFARRNPTIIAIRPEDTTAMPFQDPVELYRRFGLPVQSVQTEEEMHQALTRLASFDQVLIDTPPIPAHEGRAR
ncbi:MAG: flagellar biosynthesis protein FlhF, partial [Rhodothermales bacterium]